MHLREEKKSKKNSIVIILLLLIVAVLGFVVFFLIQKEPEVVVVNSGGDSFLYENNATVGLLPGIDREALRAQMQANTDKSAMALVLNVRPVLKDGKMDILFENPDENQKDLTLELIDDETGESVFKSAALSVGSYIETISLDKEYSPGKYYLTAYITGYELETHMEVGKAAAEVIMTVQ